MTFSNLSGWGQIEEAKRAKTDLTQADLEEAIAKVTEDTDRKKVAAKVASLPLDHWHHDLETIDILLEQKPPDIHRARQLLDDIRREIFREMR